MINAKETRAHAIYSEAIQLAEVYGNNTSALAIAVFHPEVVNDPELEVILKEISRETLVSTVE